MTLIDLNIPVARDAGGWWTHPDIPEFDEDSRAYKGWLDEQGIEISYATLDCEDCDHPVYVSYFDNGNGNISDWEPANPHGGEGWHTFSIHDSEEGPVWVWARRAATTSKPEGSQE